MKNLVRFIFILGILLSVEPLAFCQTEELNFFYVDYSEYRDPIAGYVSGLNNRAKEEAYLKAKYCVENNWKTILYVPKSTFASIDTTDKKITERLFKPPGIDLTYPINFDHDSKVIRDYVYKAYERYGKFISLNFYFYLPPHSAKNFFLKYNGLRNFLLDELSQKGVFTDNFTISFNLATSDESIPRKDRILLTEKNLKPDFYFLSNEVSFSNSFQNVQFKNY